MVDYTDKAKLIDLINSEVVKINSLNANLTVHKQARTLSVRFNEYSAEVFLDQNTKVFYGDLQQVYAKLLEYRTKAEK